MVTSIEIQKWWDEEFEALDEDDDEVIMWNELFSEEAA